MTHMTHRWIGNRKTYSSSLKDQKSVNPIWCYEHLSDILIRKKPDLRNFDENDVRVHHATHRWIDHLETFSKTPKVKDLTTLSEVMST